jgi:RNA polymerase sigma-70 factor (ECF subfamily)
MDAHQTQPSLLSRLRDPANQGAWHEFEQKYRELIVRYCRRRGLQLADAEDVLQIVMLNMSRALPKFIYDPQRGKFRGYLYRAVRGAIFQQHARPKNVPQALDTVVLAQAADGTDEVDAVWEEEWTRHHYATALAALHDTVEAKSVAVFDRLVAGESVEAVATAFGMSTDAVHKIKQRMRKRVQELIEEQIRAEDALDE